MNRGLGELRLAKGVSFALETPAILTILSFSQDQTRPFRSPIAICKFMSSVAADNLLEAYNRTKISVMVDVFLLSLDR